LSRFPRVALRSTRGYNPQPLGVEEDVTCNLFEVEGALSNTWFVLRVAPATSATFATFATFAKLLHFVL
jgi:hypothetical protein